MKNLIVGDKNFFVVLVVGVLFALGKYLEIPLLIELCVIIMIFANAAFNYYFTRMKGKVFAHKLEVKRMREIYKDLELDLGKR